MLPGRLITYGLRRYGAVIGDNVTFTAPIVFHNFADKAAKPFANLTVGDSCYLGRHILLDLKDRITLDDCVTLAMQVTVVTHTDVANSPLGDGPIPSSTAPVHVHRGAYVGAGATILQGAVLGECSVVAAGAVVNRSVPSHAVYGGVPAREIKRLQ